MSEKPKRTNYLIEQREVNNVEVSILLNGNISIAQGLKTPVIIEKSKIDLLMIACNNLK